MINTKYRCRQSELYIIAKLAWISCKKYLHLFAKLSAIYTEEYIIARQNDIIQAMRLPDFEARTGQAATLYINLVDYLPIILNALQKLKRHIARIHPKAQHKLQFQTAGGTHYRKVSNKDWESTYQMLSSMINYISTNLEALCQKSNMPPTFLDEVITILNTFTTMHQNFIETDQEATYLTETKVGANNLIYEDVNAMFADARTLPLAPAIKKQFTFSYMQKHLSNRGKAGFKGIIINAETGLPIPGVKILIPSLHISTETLSDGTYPTINLKSGKHTIILQAPNYITQK